MQPETKKYEEETKTNITQVPT